MNFKRMFNLHRANQTFNIPQRHMNTEDIGLSMLINEKRFNIEVALIEYSRVSLLQLQYQNIAVNAAVSWVTWARSKRE
jgi:hypothetical protein